MAKAKGSKKTAPKSTGCAKSTSTERVVSKTSSAASKPGSEKTKK